jgi:signal peptidase I
MTLNADPSIEPSPWVSLWLAPRETIARILATNPRHQVLLLASLPAGLNIGALLIDYKQFDWRLLLAGALAGPVLGIANLYVNGLALSWIGKLFGGRATALQMRAVLAWGAASFLIGLLLDITTKLALQSATNIGVAEPLANALRLVLGFVVVILTAWAGVATMLMLARVQDFGFWRTFFSFGIGTVIGALPLSILIALSIRALLFQPFYIPTMSMMPTLLAGDYMFASKFDYGYSRYSFPFSPPLFDGRIFAAEPQRGDVVVFRSPKDTSVDYVKRIVGLPNDRIQMINGVLNINGTPIKHERMEDFLWTDKKGRRSEAKRWRETLPNGVSYVAIDLKENGILDNTPVYTVPPGHYFAIGDNLDNSLDSRLPDQFGYVPFENIVGRARIIFFSREPSDSDRFDRIGMTVK